MKKFKIVKKALIIIIFVFLVNLPIQVNAGYFNQIDESFIKNLSSYYKNKNMIDYSDFLKDNMSGTDLEEDYFEKKYPTFKPELSKCNYSELDQYELQLLINPNCTRGMLGTFGPLKNSLIKPISEYLVEKNKVDKIEFEYFMKHPFWNWNNKFLTELSGFIDRNNELEEGKAEFITKFPNFKFDISKCTTSDYYIFYIQFKLNPHCSVFTGTISPNPTYIFDGDKIVPISSILELAPKNQPAEVKPKIDNLEIQKNLNNSTEEVLNTTSEIKSKPKLNENNNYLYYLLGFMSIIGSSLIFVWVKHKKNSKNIAS